MDDKNGGINQVHFVEVVGPILPHHLVNYCDLYKRTQDGDYTMTLNTHDPSVPFNIDLGPSDHVCETEVREKLNLSHRNSDTFFMNTPLCDRLSCAKEIHCDHGVYSLLT